MQFGGKMGSIHGASESLEFQQSTKSCSLKKIVAKVSFQHVTEVEK